MFAFRSLQIRFWFLINNLKQKPDFFPA